MTRKPWKALTMWQRRSIGLLGAIQLVLLIAAQVDLSERSESELNGSKRMWRILTFVNYIGPIAYFAFGRRVSSQEAQL